MGKLASKGTKLQVEISDVYTTIAHIDRLSGPSDEVQSVATPTLDQIGAKIPKDTTGYVDPGVLDFDMYWDSALASHQELVDLVATPEVRNFKLVLSDDSEEPFAGILKKVSRSFEIGQLVKASGSVEVAGDPLP